MMKQLKTLVLVFISKLYRKVFLCKNGPAYTKDLFFSVMLSSAKSNV